EAVARLRARTPLEVHVHVVMPRRLAVDDDVVPGTARLVAAVLHAAAARGDDPLAAVGEDVLGLVHGDGARGSGVAAVAVLPAQRELVREEADRAVVALGAAAID